MLGPEQLDILEKLFKIYPFQLEWEDFEGFEEVKRQIKISQAAEIMVMDDQITVTRRRDY